MLNWAWNGRVLAMPSALFSVSRSLFLRALNHVSTWSYRSNLGSCSKGVVIQHGTTIRHPARVSVGANVHIGRGVSLGAEIPANLKLEDGVKINKGCHIDFSGGVTIGRNCTISEEVRIQSHTHGADPRSRPEGMPLEIGENVWIGARAIILHNVSQIARGSLVAAGAVVTKPVAEGVIVGGNPAQVIRELGGGG